MGWNYLSLPLIPAYGTTLLRFDHGCASHFCGYIMTSKPTEAIYSISNMDGVTGTGEKCKITWRQWIRPKGPVAANNEYKKAWITSLFLCILLIGLLGAKLEFHSKHNFLFNRHMLIKIYQCSHGLVHYHWVDHVSVDICRVTIVQQPQRLQLYESYKSIKTGNIIKRTRATERCV